MRFRVFINRKHFIYQAICCIILRIRHIKENYNRMNKISKKFLIISMMVLTSLFIISCGGSGTTDNTNVTTESPSQPSITPDPENPDFSSDTIYYQGQDYTVTYGELYHSILVNDGVDQLIEMVDRQLLADYLSQVTEDDINEKRQELIFGTKDQDIIDEIDDEQLEDMQISYQDGMTVLGFNEDDSIYIELLVARDLYVKDLLTDPDYEDRNYVTAEDVADQYAQDRLGEVNSIVIRFDTQTEALDMLKAANLVELNQELRLYTGTKPLDDVPSYNINETNTRAISDDELLAFYIGFYNDVYDGSKDALSEDASLEDLIALDDLSYDYETLVETSSALGGLLFDTLSTMNETNDSAYYTYRPYRISLSSGNDYYLVLNLDKTHLDLTEFEGSKETLVDLISQELYDSISQEIVAKYLATSSFVAGKMQDYREDSGLVIYDYYLRLDYESVVPDDIETTDFDQMYDRIASFDGEDILVIDLLDFALERKAPLYLIHASQLEILKNTHYDDIYCDDDGNCETDWTQNNSAAMNTHLSEYTSLQESFLSSQYVNLYSFEEALYMFYGVRNEDEMIDAYIKMTIEPLIIYDYVLANKDALADKMMPYITDYYDNFFSLDTSHILIYIDENGDGSPDDYESYYEALEDQAAFDTLIGNFELDIRNYLSDNDDNLSDFVSLYNAASRDDEDWGVYKQKGLKVLTENLSSSNSLNYSEIYLSYELPFVEGLTSLYQTYQMEENLSKDFMYSEGLVETSYGLHLIKAEPGDYFDLDSADFTVPDDTDYNYPDGLNNDSERLSVSQLKVYFDYEVFPIVSSVVDLETIYNFEKPDIPDRLEGLFELFVKNLYDAHYASAYLNIAIMDILSSGNMVDNSSYAYFNKAEILEYFDILNDVYENQIYQDFE